MKKELFLIYFIYHGMTSDFPVSYTIILILTYLSVITYRIIRLLRKNKEQTEL
ncbi:hypothetical protein [Bacillus safensis]|uniref:hypothetical protein n=1 Tax=Bacillus safensis TaxID=561879 RepID=UPI000AD3558B|nr:hypothetical protein [Bacillus safensis]